MHHWPPRSPSVPVACLHGFIGPGTCINVCMWVTRDRVMCLIQMNFKYNRLSPLWSAFIRTSSCKHVGGGVDLTVLAIGCETIDTGWSGRVDVGKAHIESGECNAVLNVDCKGAKLDENGHYIRYLRVANDQGLQLQVNVYEFDSFRMM